MNFYFDGRVLLLVCVCVWSHCACACFCSCVTSYHGVIVRVCSKFVACTRGVCTQEDNISLVSNFHQLHEELTDIKAIAH